MKATHNRYCVGALISMLAFASVPFQSVTVLAVSPKASERANARAYREMPEQAQNTKKTKIAPTSPAIVATPVVSRTASATTHQDPAGNNGTIKIDSTPFDSHPDNQPHVACTFQVDFYGYDKGVGNASVDFALHSPTSDGRTLRVTSGDLTPDIGEDAAGGGTDLDASETYTLAFTGAPHSKQGYHVKLTVNAPGSQGADVKHKVFWVSPCETPVTPENPVTPGVILGESTSITRPAAILPSTLPTTGSVAAHWLLGILAALNTYGIVYALQSRNIIRSKA